MELFGTIPVKRNWSYAWWPKVPNNTFLPAWTTGMNLSPKCAMRPSLKHRGTLATLSLQP